jgi:hypothetical protein
MNRRLVASFKSDMSSPTLIWPGYFTRRELNGTKLVAIMHAK